MLIQVFQARVMNAMPTSCPVHFLKNLAAAAAAAYNKLHSVPTNPKCLTFVHNFLLILTRFVYYI